MVVIEHGTSEQQYAALRCRDPQEDTPNIIILDTI